MKKFIYSVKIIFIATYFILIFILMIWNKNVSLKYELPIFIIPTIFFVSMAFVCYKYLISTARENKLEQEIVSIVNHSFRTPLTSMVWHIKELEKNIPQNEKFIYLQNLNNNVNKLLNVIDVLVGIKDVNNTSGYFFKAMSLREIVEKSVQKYREKINKKNISFKISTFKDIPLLTLDLKKISFVIDTLIENAILYTNQDGKILIDCITNTRALTLFISDTGTGLSTIDKMMIFSKFYRSKRARLMNPDGMGLRLYLSKEIMKRHGGRIYAKSNGLNEGSTFFIDLPYKR